MQDSKKSSSELVYQLQDSRGTERVDKLKAQLTDMGLQPPTIARHQRNVRASLSKQKSRSFPIWDTCRPDNGGIVPCIRDSDPGIHAVVSFIPAAGASSRWLAPLAPLMEALRNHDQREVEEALTVLVQTNMVECPLPDALVQLVAYWREHGYLPDDWRADELLVNIDAPKALYPAVVDGITFLELKRAEDEAMRGLAGEVFICPPGRSGEFLQRVQQISHDPKLPVTVLEQGMKLATVRFDAQGDICLSADGAVSSVPSGHGALLELLPEVSRAFPKADSIWIRNIDNVVGTSPSVVAASKDFLGTHRLILNGVQKIREALSKGDRPLANAAAKDILSYWPLAAGIKEPWNASELDLEDPLVVVLARIFHAPLNGKESLATITAFFARPVVTMGQVPNTARDVGGTCVFAEVEGEVQKLCLEVPHASETDRKVFLANPAKATHFNPVFVAAEIPDEATLRQWDDHPFWLVANKTWLGQKVCYQESILYEMLGSSKYTNVTFVEVPRILFNPHKGLPDARNRKRQHWL